METHFDIPIPEGLSLNDYSPVCIPLPRSQLILPEQEQIIRYGSSDLRKLPRHLAKPLLPSVEDARYTFGEYVTADGIVRNSLFIEEQLPGIRFIYETDLDHAMPGLYPMVNSYAILDNRIGVNLVQELPPGANMWYLSGPIMSYALESKSVIIGNHSVYYRYSNRLNDPGILAILHEIGHSISAYRSHVEYPITGIPRRLTNVASKIVRNLLTQKGVYTPEQIEEIDRKLTEEIKATTYAKSWLTQMDALGHNFVPCVTPEQRDNSLLRAFATHILEYFPDRRLDPTIASLFIPHYFGADPYLNPETEKYILRQMALAERQDGNGQSLRLVLNAFRSNFADSRKLMHQAHKLNSSFPS